MGTSEFGIPTLKLLNQEFNLKAVITNVDKRSGRGLNFKESEVKIFAKKNKIHFLQPDNLKDPNFIEQICCLKPDFIIIALPHFLRIEPILECCKNNINLAAIVANLFVIPHF